jgi:hypothetical protein
MLFASHQLSYLVSIIALDMEFALRTLTVNLNVHVIMDMVEQTASTNAIRDALLVMVLMRTNVQNV